MIIHILISITTTLVVVIIIIIICTTLCCTTIAAVTITTDSTTVSIANRSIAGIIHIIDSIIMSNIHKNRVIILFVIIQREMR